jgi:hypothetical protein
MTHSVNMANTGILGVGRDMSMVLGVSLKRPRAPGSLWCELATMARRVMRTRKAPGEQIRLREGDDNRKLFERLEEARAENGKARHDERE